MRLTVPVHDQGAGLADEQASRGGIPWLVGEDDGGVELSVGDPCQVGGGRSDHADPLDALGESGCDGQAVDVLLGGVVADGVIAEGDHRVL